MNSAYLKIIILIAVVLMILIILSRNSKYSPIRLIALAPTPTLTKAQIEKNKIEEYIKSNISQMTIPEKVGQLFIWGVGEDVLSAKTAEKLKNLQAGGVILMGSRNRENLKNITDAIKSIGIKLPLFISIDQEGGLVRRLTDDQNPGAQVLGKLDNSVFCEYLKNTQNLLIQAGVNVNLGLVGDVGWKKNSFIFQRTFGDDPEEVAKKITLAINCSPDIILAIKHFPGHGRTNFNSHTSVPKIDISEVEWLKTDFLPFQKAIENKIGMIMMGHLIYEKMASSPASLSSFYPKVLRDSGFEGLIITDDIKMLETSGFDTYSIIDKAISSGNDLILVAGSIKKYEDIYTYVLEMVNDGILKECDINDRLKRILRIKYGLRIKDNAENTTEVSIADYIVITETPVPTPTFTPTPTPKPMPKLYIGNLDSFFTKYSNQYSVSPDLLKRIANCESHFNSNSVNGPYGGMFQFHEGTWMNIRRIMNENTDPNLRYNAEEAIKTAAFKISVNGAASWPNCSK
jgi:beta-glucosidase-like glycosyl hydrolase